jgi:hypothetical protein
VADQESLFHPSDLQSTSNVCQAARRIGIGLGDVDYLTLAEAEQALGFVLRHVRKLLKEKAEGLR